MIVHLTLENPMLPFRTLCHILAGVVFFGEGEGTASAPAGYDYNGLFRTHPRRIAAFWSKEIILDLMGLGTWGPRLRMDMLETVPVGNGSRRGLGLALGLMKNANDPTPPQLLGSGAAKIMKQVFEMKDKFDCGDLVDDLNGIEWN